MLTLDTRRRTLATGFFCAATLISAPASASLLWHWQYTGVDIEANGQFTTTDSANSNGYYEIIGITGTRNGEAITALIATGDSIPGNEPYASDNWLRPGLDNQITEHGFGFSTADGRYANPYWAAWLDPQSTVEVLTADPDTFIDEVAVSFTATLIPEPSTIGLLLSGLGMLGLSVRLSAHLAPGAYPIDADQQGTAKRPAPLSGACRQARWLARASYFAQTSL